MRLHLLENLNRAALCRTLTVALVIVISLGSATAVQADDTSFDCVIDPSRVVKLGSSEQGLLSDVLVERGDLVKKAQVIARLESSVEAIDLEYNRLTAESTAAIDAQKVRLSLSRTRLERAEVLLKKNVITQDEYDEVLSDLEVDEQDLEQELLDHELDGIEAKRSGEELNQRTIYSPIDGVVHERLLSAGEYISESGYVVELVQLDPLYVEAFLPVEMFPAIHVGMTGIVIPDAPIGGRYSAEVIVVDYVFDPSSNTFGVRMALPNTDNLLPAGQRCTVRFPEVHLDNGKDN